jgi:uncharacterized protein
MSREFFEAIARDDRTAVEAAIEADPELLKSHDGSGRSPIVAAAFGGHTRLARSLADRMVPSDLNFFEAVTLGETRIVRERLAAGAEADDRGSDGYGALHLAAWFGRLDVARLLLERGADPNVVALNDSRVTPLHSAVAAHHRDLVALLMALGASANVIQKGGRTPLHSAASDGDEGIVDLLLLRGADPTRPADDGRTPIDMAEQGGHGALAEVLREATRD